VKTVRVGKIITIWFTICTLVFLSAGLISHCPVNAAGGIALSGSFSSQTFEIPQGSSLSAPSVDVVVFNNLDEAIGIRMSAEAPVGVTVNLSESEFTLAAGGQKAISISVEVTTDAAPGNYSISITATSFKEDVEGKIQLLGSARQTAPLQVLGESATVNVQAISPDGTPIIAIIRLFKQIGSNRYEFAYSETGVLDAVVVSPGSYVVEGYVGGQLMDSESFDIATGETKTITLTVGTIYFEQFDILEYTNNDTGKFAFAEMVYTIKNVYEQVDNATVLLEVKRDGSSLEQKQIGSFSPLVVGSVGQSYQYTPIDGWTDGNYSFKLILKIDNEIYTSSPERQIDISSGNGPSDQGNDSNMPLIVGIVCAVVLLLDIAFYMIYRSRKAKHTQSGTKKSKRRE
jgi:hypothetical protein